MNFVLARIMLCMSILFAACALTTHTLHIMCVSNNEYVIEISAMATAYIWLWTLYPAAASISGTIQPVPIKSMRCGFMFYAIFVVSSFAGFLFTGGTMPVMEVFGDALVLLVVWMCLHNFDIMLIKEKESRRRDNDNDR